MFKRLLRKQQMAQGAFAFFSDHRKISILRSLRLASTAHYLPIVNYLIIALSCCFLTLTGPHCNGASASQDAKNSLPAKEQAAQNNHSIKMLACVKCKPLPTVLNEYVKMVESIVPEYASTIALLLTGSFGGMNCPGVSSEHAAYIAYFSTDKNFTPLYFFNAQDDAYLVKILQGLPQAQKSVNSLQPLPSSKIIEDGWKVFGDTKLINNMKGHWDELMTFLKAPFDTDIQARVFLSSLDCKLLLGKELEAFGKFLLNEIESVQIDLKHTDNNTLSLIYSNHFTEQSKFIRLFPKRPATTVTLKLPKSHLQSDIHSVYLSPYIDLTPLLAKEFIDTLNTIIPASIANYFDWPKIQEMIQSIDTWQKKHAGHMVSTATMVDAKAGNSPCTYFSPVNKLKDAELVQFLDDLINVKLNAFLKSVIPTSGAKKEANNPPFVCRFDKEVFTYKNKVVHGCTIAYKLDVLDMLEQLFFTLVNDNLLCANNRQAMEKFIDECSSKDFSAPVTLSTKALMDCTINLESILNSFFSNSTIQKAPEAENYLKIKTIQEASTLQLQVDLPLSCLSKLTTLLKNQANAGKAPSFKINE